MQEALYKISSVEPIEYGIQLENERWVSADEAVEAAMLAMSPREQAMPFQYYRVLGIHPTYWKEMVERVQDATQSDEVQSVERLNQARDESSAPLTVTAAAGTQAEGGVARAPSLVRVVRKARSGLDAGTLTPEAFAAQASAALDAADAAREAKPLAARIRGADRLQEVLLAARRRGELDPEGVEMATWFVRQNPAAVANLGISVRARAKGEESASGHYNPVSRIVTLMKGSLNPETAVHEILHHLERMMPTRLQNAIRREWAKQIAKAYKGAAGNEKLSAYYKALMDYHFGSGDPKLLEQALDMLHSGAVSYDHYQMFNPSEFWAVNGSRIVAGRFGVSGSVVGRIRQYIKEFVQRAKAILGMRSDNAVIRALDSLAQADGNFTTGLMLQDQPGVHFMYAGQQTADQEQAAQLQRYGWMKAGGHTPAELRAATGWFRSPLDNELRYEFSDHDAEFTTLRPPERMQVAGAREEPTTYRLDEVLDHPALFEAYPQAREIQVTRQESVSDYGRRVQGWFNPDQNRVNITPYAKDPLSTLLHELQHWVQQKEGFAVGGSPEMVARAMSPEQRARLRERVLKEILPQHQEDQRAIDFMVKLQGWPRLNELMAAASHGVDARGEGNEEFTVLREQLVKDLTGKTYDTMDITSAAMLDNYMRNQDTDWMESQLDKFASKVEFRQEQIEATDEIDNPEALALLGADTDALLRAYQHIAGEIEARDTQARQSLTPAQRAGTKPFDAEADVLDMRDVVRVKTPTGPMGSYLNVERPVDQRVSTFDKAVDKSTRGLRPQHARYVKSYTNTVRGALKQVNNWITFTPDIIRKALAGLPSAKAYMDAMQASDVNRRGRMEQVAKVRDAFARLTLGERTAVNKLMYESTISDKWAYQPGHVFVDKKDVDPKLARDFKALSPAAQQAVRDQFAHNHADLLAMKTAVVQSINEEYDATIMQFEDAGESERADAAREKKAKALAAYDKLMSIRSDTPYAPLKRFGNFVVVGKSQAYMDAEEAGDTKAMSALETDPAHYRVEMRETRGEAKVLSDEMAAQFPDGITEHFAKDSTYDSLGTAQMMAGFARLQRQSTDAGEKVSVATQAQLKRMMTDLYYSMLSEASARQSERRRIGVAGADADMMRAFATKGQANANFISMLESNGRAQSALTQMRKEAHRAGVQDGTTREERADWYNEILKRHSMSMDWRPTPTVDFLLQGSSYWTLISSPASWLVNATQTMAISVPVMGGRHGARAMTEAMKSYREMSVPLWKAFRAGTLNAEAILAIAPADVRDGIAKLIAEGHISGENNFDLKKWKTNGGDGPLGTLAKINDKFMDVSTAVELLNRMTAAVTAMRLEKARDPKTDGTAYAGRIIYETHGDYSGFAAPAWMRTPAGRIVGQFRKFQLIQLGMYARLFKSAFMDANLTREERWAARKSLGWLLTSMGMWGGALGMPGAQVIGLVVGAVFGDDDEPDNQEQTMRKLIGNEDVADMLLQGLPSGLLGVNMSGRVGAGSLGNPLPFGKAGWDKESMTTNVVAALGPLVGTSIKAVDGVNTMVTGDFWKGVEAFLPKGFANAVKGADIMVRGVQQKNGDTVMSADEIGAFDAFMQGIGLPTTKITDRSFRSNYAYESKQFYNQKTSAVKQDYVQAYKAGDTEALTEARQKWNELQAAKKANGYKPSPLSDLIKAPREQVKREKNTVGGVQFRAREEGAIRQLAEL